LCFNIKRATKDRITMNCTQEEIKKASVILQFRKLILTKISSCYTHRRQVIFLLVDDQQTRHVKKKELSIKDRYFLLYKKCLNAIGVRVWPGNDEIVGRWKQSSETEGKK